MQLYWRVMEELKFLGETLVFRDPVFRRAFAVWCKKNHRALSRMTVRENILSSPERAALKALRSLN